MLPYKGFVFIGLIKVGEDPKVIEYNVRMGDPETEVVLPRLKNDLVEIFQAIANQTLDKIEIEIDPRAATTVMLVSGGYPEAYEKGMEITGLDLVTDSIAFHAGAINKDGKIVTSGGRVMAITSFGDTYQEAIEISYQKIENEIDPRAATTVMLVSGGYPEAYEKGMEITGLDLVTDSIAFHAGAINKDGKIVTSGGRVMAITSFGDTYQEAIKKSYQNIEKLHFDKMNYRKDIGFDL